MGYTARLSFVAIPMSACPDLATVQQAHRLMDDAAGLARRTFDAQGLPEAAAAVEQVIVAASPATPGPAPMPSDPSPAAHRINWRLITPAVMMLIGMITIMTSIVAARLAPEPTVKPSVPVARVPLTDIQAVDLVRTLAANATSTQMQGALTGQTQVIDIWNSDTYDREGKPPESQEEVKAIDMADLGRRGALTSVDYEGRPELTWSHVSGTMCHALVQDIYLHPSTHGVAVTVDGKDRNVSCAGNDHVIVLSPHL